MTLYQSEGLGVSVACVTAGDIRLELQGTDLLITGKQAMTGEMVMQCFLHTGTCVVPVLDGTLLCRQQNGVSQPVTCWNFQSSLQAAQGGGHQQP